MFLSLSLEDIENIIRPLSADHTPHTKLICLENTQLEAGGVSLSAEYIDSVGALAKKHGLKLHIDGARIFHAAIEQKTSVKELVKSADSIAVCLSKGLCAPAGSLLLGSKEFISEARQKRQIVGGELKQAGVLAAAGRIALHKMSQGLKEDHQNATLLAALLKKCTFIDRVTSATNVVSFHLTPEAEPIRDFIESRCSRGGNKTESLRMFTHFSIAEGDIRTIVDTYNKLELKGKRKRQSSIE